jgi:hypothetical protein
MGEWSFNQHVLHELPTLQDMFVNDVKLVYDADNLKYRLQPQCHLLSRCTVYVAENAPTDMYAWFAEFDTENMCVVEDWCSLDGVVYQLLCVKNDTTWSVLCAKVVAGTLEMSRFIDMTFVPAKIAVKLAL